MSHRWTHQIVEIKVQLFGTSMTERAQDELNRASLQGWELVSAVQSEAADSLRLFFKKPA